VAEGCRHGKMRRQPQERKAFAKQGATLFFRVHLSVCHWQKLLITEALSASANFFFYRTLAVYMRKGRKDIKCVVLSVSQDITRWKAIAAKSVIIVFSVSFFPFRGQLLKQKPKFFIISICSIVWTRDLSSS
jgi:hypothetical protein